MAEVRKQLTILLIITLLCTVFTGCSAPKRDSDRDRDDASRGLVGEAMEVLFKGLGYAPDEEDSEKEADEDNDDKDNKDRAEEDEWLIGTWFYSNASGNVGMAIIYEFKEDGTFTKAIGSISGYTHYATGFEGDFKVSDDTLVFYNQYKSEGIASSKNDDFWYLRIADSAIKDIPLDDSEEPFRLKDDGTLVIGDTEYQPLDL